MMNKISNILITVVLTVVLTLTIYGLALIINKHSAQNPDPTATPRDVCKRYGYSDYKATHTRPKKNIIILECVK